MVRRFVWSRNLDKEEAMAHFGPQRHKRKKFYTTCDIIVTD
jgi:hypothetical protein